MTAAVSRRAFLRGARQDKAPVLRPPWALAEEAFLARCTRCHQCLEHCPSGIIFAGDGGFPEIDFGRGECTFCADCVTHCEPAVLQRDGEGQAPWQLDFALAPHCLPLQGVECRVCGEACPTGAIRFRPRLGAPAGLHFDAAACTACGACVAPCPVTAISLTPGVNVSRESSA